MSYLSHVFLKKNQLRLYYRIMYEKASVARRVSFFDTQKEGE